MFKIALAVLFAVLLGHSSTAYSDMGKVERRFIFRGFVEIAVDQLGIKESVGHLVTTSELDSIASVRQVDLVSGSLVYLVVIASAFLQEAVPDVVLKHIAFHEICHLAKKHHKEPAVFSSSQRQEDEAEDCARTSIGEVQHAESIAWFKQWRPHSFYLKDEQSLRVDCLFEKRCK